MKTDLELGRQLIHIVTGIIIVILLFFEVINKWVILGLVILGVILFLIRLKTPLDSIDKIVKPFERKNEKHHYEGPLTFLMGIMAVLFIFDKNIALASILIMTLGDGASTVFGTLLGRRKIPWSNKTFTGSFFGIIFAFAGAVFFVNWLYALIASVAALIVECFDRGLMDINDNILMPVVAGAVLAIMAAL